MEIFEAKTLEDAIDKACDELNVQTNELHYNVIEEKKTLFSKKVVIECYSDEMVETFISNYLKTILNDLGFEIETVTFRQNNRVYCNIDSDNNSILIGRSGIILRTLNFIVKTAIANEFKDRIEISLDINGYKESRYKKVAAMAKRFGKQVQRTRVAAILDPLPADERKVMHQVISEMDHLKTESKGEGRNRHLTIQYVD